MDEMERAAAVNVIEAARERHVNLASEESLVKYAFLMADDIFKAANRPWNRLDSSLYSYLEASSGSLCQLLLERGFAIHYLIDNTFKNSFQGMFNPLEFFKDWFRASGFIYVCPQEIAMDVLESLGKDKSEYFELLPSLMKEARHIANEVLERCHRERLHYVFLDTDSQSGPFDMSLSYKENPKQITIIRVESPVPGSNCIIMCVDENGNSLVEGLRRLSRC